MSLVNYATNELTLKIVYYGPGLSGKTTNLQYLHSKIPAAKKGKLLSLATESDRTLFFDFLPVELGKIKDFTVKIQLYTVPGQVRYNATRKLVLRGADAVVFVADSQTEMMEANIESYANMMDNLRENSLDPGDIPVVLQYNKRDLGNAASIDALNKALNPKGVQVFMAEAIHGTGVEETFQATVRVLLADFNQKIKRGPAAKMPTPKKEAPAPEILHGSEQYSEWRGTPEAPAGKNRKPARPKPAEPVSPAPEETETSTPEAVLAGFEFQTDWSFQSETEITEADVIGGLPESIDIMEAEAVEIEDVPPAIAEDAGKPETETIPETAARPKQEIVTKPAATEKAGETADIAAPAEKPGKEKTVRVAAGAPPPAISREDIREEIHLRTEMLELQLSDITAAIVSLKNAVSDLSAKVDGLNVNGSETNNGTGDAAEVDISALSAKLEAAIDVRLKDIFKDTLPPGAFKDTLRLLRELKMSQGDILTTLEKLESAQNEPRKKSGFFRRSGDD